MLRAASRAELSPRGYAGTLPASKLNPGLIGNIPLAGEGIRPGVIFVPRFVVWNSDVLIIWIDRMLILYKTGVIEMTKKYSSNNNDGDAE